MTPRADTPACRGTTLIELLVGLGIFAVVAAAVYLVYAQAVRVDRAVSRRATAVREAWWAVTAVQEDLERAVFYHYSGAIGGGRRLAFAGEAQRLALVVEGDRHLRWVVYRARVPEEGAVHTVQIGGHFQRNVDQVLHEARTAPLREELIRTVGDFTGTPPVGDPGGDMEVLTEDLMPGGLRFQYAAGTAAAGGGGLAWQDTWAAADPPAAVRISLRLAADEAGTAFEISRDVWLAAGGPDGGRL